MSKLILLGAMLSLCTLGFSQSSEQPNIIMIVVDDLNDYIGFLDDSHPQTLTPNLNRLARNGTIFHNAHCTSPKSSPSRTSFLSGKDPNYTGVYNNENIQYAFRDNFSVSAAQDFVYTMPEVMKDSGGYYTLGINKVYFGWKNSDFDNDFDDANPDPCTREKSWSDNIIIPPQDLTTLVNDGFNNFIWTQIDDTLESKMFDYLVIDTVIDFMNDYSGSPGNYCNKPFFVTAGIFLPHKPLIVPEKYFMEDYLSDFYSYPADLPYNEPYNAYPPNGVIMPPNPSTPYYDYLQLPPTGQEFALAGNDHGQFVDYADDLVPTPMLDSSFSVSENRLAIAESQRANAVISYLAAVHFVDQQVGRLLDELETMPFADNTVVIFTSDHGYALGEKTHWHKFGLWETDNRIPLCIMDPRRPSGQEVKTAVSILDLFPTLLDYAGVDYPTFPDGSPYLDGRSLVPFMDQPDFEQERPVLTSLRKSKGPSKCFRQFSVRSDEFHYIKWTSPFGGSASTCDTANAEVQEELYHIGRDREIDPNEWNNLAGNPDWDDMKDYLSQWLPDSGMYSLKGATVNILTDPNLPCALNYTDSVNLYYELFGPDGLSYGMPPNFFKLYWHTSVDPTPINQRFLRTTVADLMDLSTFNSRDDFVVYLQVADTLDRKIALDGIRILLNSGPAPGLSFTASKVNNVVSIDGLNYTGRELISGYSFDFGDGTIYEDSLPPSHTYTDNGTFTITGTVTYQNSPSNPCTTSHSTSITLNAGDLNGGDCLVPSNFRISGLSPNKAYFQWNEVYSADDFELRVRALNGPDTSWHYFTTSTNSYTVNTLDPNFDYAAQIRTNCTPSVLATDQSNWSYPLYFTTSNCFAPRNVQVSDISSTSAMLSWTAESFATFGYRVVYGLSPSTSTTITTSANELLLTGLDPDEEYFYKIRSQCDQFNSSGFYASSFTPSSTFNTSTLRLAVPALDLVNLYPNPAKNLIRLQYEAPADGQLQLAIVDLYGRLMEKRVLTQQKGTNTYSIPLKGYRPGVYFVQLNSNEHSFTKKFSVMK